MSSDNRVATGIGEVEEISQIQVVILSIACGFSIANAYYNQPLLPVIGASFGHPDHTGLITTCTQLGYALGLLLFVPLGDRLNRRRLVMCLISGVIIGQALCGLAPSFGAFELASFVVGLTTVSGQIVTPAIASLVRPERRGQVIGTLLSGMSAGLLFARTLSGVVADHFGWRAMFFLAMALDCGLIAMVWATLPRLPATTSLAYPKLMASLWRLFRDEPALRVAGLTAALFFAAWSVLWATIAALLARPPYGFGAGIAGSLGLLGVFGLIASPLIGQFTDRFGSAKVLAVGAVMVIVAFALAAGGIWHFWLLILGIALLDIGNRVGLIANQTRVYALDPASRSRINTVFMVCFFGGGVAGSILGTIAVEHAGWAGLGLAGGGFAAVALLIHWMGSRDPRFRHLP